MPALSAEMSAFTTRWTLPPERKWASSSLTLSAMPALCAVISGSTIAAGFTLRSRMPMSVRNETRTPEASARIQSPIGTKCRNTAITRIAKNTRARINAMPTAESSATEALL